MIFNQFDRVYIINLPERQDRFRRITRELLRVGADPRCRPFEVFKGIRPESTDGFPSIGARGIFLTQLKIFKDALQKGYAKILLIEDDVMFTKSFFSSQELISRELAQVKWDIIYLGHHLTPGHSPAGLFRNDSYIIFMHFMGFNKRVLHDLIGFMEAALQRLPGHPDGGPMHSDGMLNMFRVRNPGILTYIANPSLGYQGPSRSDITVSVFDRLDKTGMILKPLRWLKTKWRL
ncbi:MAG: LPS biosynthesis glycosyltransferase [Candidatus Omnitrophota bacterium]